MGLRHQLFSRVAAFFPGNRGASPIALDWRLSGKVAVILGQVLYLSVIAAALPILNKWPHIGNAPPSTPELTEQRLARVADIVPPQASVRFVWAKPNEPDSHRESRLGRTRYVLVPRELRTEGPADWLLWNGNPEDQPGEAPGEDGWKLVLDVGKGIKLFRRHP